MPPLYPSEITIPARNERRPQKHLSAQVFVDHEVRVQGREHGFKRENQGRMRRRSVLLRPHLAAVKANAVAKSAVTTMAKIRRPVQCKCAGGRERNSQGRKNRHHHNLASARDGGMKSGACRFLPGDDVDGEGRGAKQC